MTAHSSIASCEYSIADIACFPWVRIHKLANLSIEKFPNVARWYGAIRRRPAVSRGLEILRDHLTGVPSTKEAHDVVFGKGQFRELDEKLAAKESGR
jgi:GST-like protein